MPYNGLVHVVGADFEERSCPKDTELRCENQQLAYHRTPPCNMYCVVVRFYLISILGFIKYLIVIWVQCFFVTQLFSITSISLYLYIFLGLVVKGLNEKLFVIKGLFLFSVFKGFLISTIFLFFSK